MICCLWILFYFLDYHIRYTYFQKSVMNDLLVFFCEDRYIPCSIQNMKCVIFLFNISLIIIVLKLIYLILIIYKNLCNQFLLNDLHDFYFCLLILNDVIYCILIMLKVIVLVKFMYFTLLCSYQYIYFEWFYGFCVHSKFNYYLSYKYLPFYFFNCSVLIILLILHFRMESILC